MSPTPPQKRFAFLLWAMSLLCLMILLLAGLWPLNFNPPNMVDWFPHQNGIRFSGKGMVYGPNPFKSSKDPEFRNALTIELWARPYSNRYWGLPRILTFCDIRKADTFFIEQWRSDLILRYERKGGGKSGGKSYRQIGFPGAFVDGARHFISITSGPAGTTFYLDGRPVKNYRLFSLPVENVELSEYVVLGNSSSGQEQWKGSLTGLAFYDRCLSAEEVYQDYRSWTQNGHPGAPEEGLVALYLLDEGGGHLLRNHRGPAQDLEFAEAFRPLKRIILELPWLGFRFNPTYLQDVAINVLGFVPFGFFLAALLMNTPSLSRRRAYVLTLLVGGTISLLIELTQAFLPTRNSNLRDLLCNLFGTALGLLAVSACLPYFVSKKWMELVGKSGD